MDGRGSGASTASFPMERGGVSTRLRPAKIYYLDGRVLGAVNSWRPHLARAQELGFDSVCVSPLFAPGATGDVFLAADFEAAAPFLSAGESVDEAVRAIAALCQDNGLDLLLD